jgi:hypothetical protein
MEQSASDIMMYAYLSKDDDNWNVTVQFYNMSTEVMSHDERIYRKTYEISNIESIKQYDLHVGQAIYGDIVDDMFKISGVKVDSKNYQV